MADRSRPLFNMVTTAVAMVLAAGLLSLPQANAGFVDTTEATGNSWASDTLAPPTGLAATSSGGNVDLSWTPTSDTYADGYRIYRSASSGGPYSLVGSVLGHSTGAYTDVGGGAGTASFETFATSATNGTSITVGTPAGVVDGDLMIAILAGENDAATLSAPAGWSLIVHQVNSGNFVGAVWYRIASSESASVTFSSTQSHAMNAGILRYGNVDATTPIGSRGTVSAFGNPTAPSVTTTVPNTVVLRIGILEDATTSDIGYPPSNTGRFEFHVASGQVTSAADAVMTTAGATGTAVFTGTSDDYIASTVAIRGGTYHYVVRAYDGTWESGNSNEAGT